MRPLSGWARTPVSHADVRPGHDPARALAEPGERGVLARGLGRSYGDAASNAGGTVLDMTDGCTTLDIDAATGVLRGGGGVSLDEIMRAAVPLGWFVPVTPGTRFVTLGGAIAADIHGKNHHRAGSISGHVRSLDVVTPALGSTTTEPGDDAFAATVGGMGLTGVVTSVELQLQRIESSAMVVDTFRDPDLDAVLQRLEDADATHDHTVAWIDPLARGRRLGRGVTTIGRHACLGDLDPRRAADPLRFDPPARLTVPDVLPVSAINLATVMAFNELWFRKAPRAREGELQALWSFFHPLDGVGSWNRVYGPRGFVQYQFVVPLDRVDALERIVEALSAAHAPAFLVVLKRFGPAAEAPLSFPVPGWTLAVDLPATAAIGELLDGLDEMVVAAGGRVYLAKDGRLPRRHLSAMYPRLQEWRALRDALDPEHRITSDLDRRLDLSGRCP